MAFRVLLAAAAAFQVVSGRTVINMYDGTNDLIKTTNAVCSTTFLRFGGVKARARDTLAFCLADRRPRAHARCALAVAPARDKGTNARIPGQRK